MRWLVSRKPVWKTDRVPAAEQAANVTGQTIAVDGGSVMT
jgi:hypothetical protein